MYARRVFGKRARPGNAPPGSSPATGGPPATTAKASSRRQRVVTRSGRQGSTAYRRLGSGPEQLAVGGRAVRSGRSVGPLVARRPAASPEPARVRGARAPPSTTCRSSTCASASRPSADWATSRCGERGVGGHGSPRLRGQPVSPPTTSFSRAALVARPRPGWSAPRKQVAATGVEALPRGFHRGRIPSRRRIGPRSR